MVNCPSCGAPIDTHLDNCPYCGTLLPNEENSANQHEQPQANIHKNSYAKQRKQEGLERKKKAAYTIACGIIGLVIAVAVDCPSSSEWVMYLICFILLIGFGTKGPCKK